MDKDLQDFESELGRLQPVAPSRALAARIERDVGAAEPVRKSPAGVHWVWFVAMPAAAAIAIMLSRVGPPLPARVHATIDAPLAATSSESFKPVAAKNVLFSARDDGVVVLDDGTPARRERLQYVDTITWKNPRTNASVRWTVPREEVRVVPISFQ